MSCYAARGFVNSRDSTLGTLLNFDLGENEKLGFF
jgi:hypothetical protein